MERENSKKIITIKRYSNRKLYDTSQSRYITLAELGEIIRRGENVEVIDNDTKADLTEMTLTQVLMTQQKQKQKGIRNLVSTQAELLLQRISVPAQQIRDEAIHQLEKQVVRLKKYADGRSETADVQETADGQEVSEKPASSLMSKLESLKSSSDEKLLSLLLVQRVEQLEKEVDDLRRRLELLEKSDDDKY